MAAYRAPIKDQRFVFQSYLDIERYRAFAGHEDMTDETLNAILTEAGKFASDVIAPQNPHWDRQGCVLENGVVRTPDGFATAFRDYAAGGWAGLTGDPAYGGQGLPRSLGAACMEVLNGASMGFGITPSLCGAAQRVFEDVASDEQKEIYLSKIVAGEWTVTMDITEPHAGTDVGTMRTKAAPVGDGSYAITGQKVWISGGDHDMADNIVHLVLAKLPGAVAGPRGISLFIVPKFLVKTDGTLGTRNLMSVGSLEDKMGNHGNPTCVMHYEDATGFLLGVEHRGLPAMFTMMNAVRLDVAVQGVAIAEAAYQIAADYAKTRLQGQGPDKNPDPNAPRDTILAHPDVRRMLLTIRSVAEAGRALCMKTGMMFDVANNARDPMVNAEAIMRASLFTPMLKSYFSEFGVEAANLAIQCLGGAGYSKNYGLEQLVRDARLGMIYEGANGIQALDLVKRKVGSDDGAAMTSFMGGVATTIANAERGGTFTQNLIQPVRQVLAKLNEATNQVVDDAAFHPVASAASAMAYLRLFALTAMAEAWLKMAQAAEGALVSAPTTDFYKTKLHTAAFFMNEILPDADGNFRRVKERPDNGWAIPNAHF